ncbi:hypothetical protein [Sphingobium sp. CFD-2]|uniref:hypothetical protein n=1 Tax=Sphingobium sp. CFD-2 TaxID=2878542 RepID=UPI00214BA803|nr:hypothetical protein [Sphingobium sp. CFD-2]
MRSDAANLLERLGRRDFRYREFTDNFADMELWPIFEALLTDERIVGKPLSPLAARNVEDNASLSEAPAAPPASPPLFSRYAPPQPLAPAGGREGLGVFLRRLSQDDLQGRG